MKKLLSLTLALAMALSLAACGGNSGGSGSSGNAGGTSTPPASNPPASTPSDTGAYDDLDPVELIGADSTGKGAAGQIFGEYVAQRVDEITGGKLTIDYHPNGDLGGDADLLRQAQNKEIDIVVCQTAPIVSFVPEMAVFDLPMSFAKYSGDTINSVLNGDNDFTKALGSAYEAQKLHLLGFLQNATYRLTSSNKKLETLADFNGLQIRTMENSNHMAFWQAIGAQPTPLAWAEVYVSLQNKMIDAEENAADTIVGANLNEVQEYLALTNHILYCNQICINAETYASLAPAYQEALDQAVADAIAYMRPQLVDIDNDNKAILQDKGMEIIEYDNAFFDSILSMDSVQKVYTDINAATNGLSDKLMAALG